MSDCGADKGAGHAMVLWGDDGAYRTARDRALRKRRLCAERKGDGDEAGEEGLGHGGLLDLAAHATLRALTRQAALGAAGIVLPLASVSLSGPRQKQRKTVIPDAEAHRKRHLVGRLQLIFVAQGGGGRFQPRPPGNGATRGILSLSARPNI